MLDELRLAKADAASWRCLAELANERADRLQTERDRLREACQISLSICGTPEMSHIEKVNRIRSELRTALAATGQTGKSDDT